MAENSLLAVLAALWGGAAMAGEPAIPWDKVPSVAVVLFYPGQSSAEWLASRAHEGAREVLAGKSCRSCHRDDEKPLGARLVAGGPLEPTPVPGKNGSLELTVQVAYDRHNAYFRLSWPTRNPWPGSEHPYYRFDGKSWQPHGGPRLDANLREGRQPAIYEDRLSLMIDDGRVPGFARQGCWLACHEGQRDMPRAASAAEAAANRLLSALGKKDVRKYLPGTRSDPSDWKSAVSPEQIAGQKTAGAFLDLIQWRAHRSAPAGMADDGYVLEFRHADTGREVFTANLDRATHQPKFMWNPAKTGYRAITAERLGKGDHFLVREENALPFDPAAGWQPGDLLPQYVVSGADASGSAADNRASSRWEGGRWTVVIARPLALANPDDKSLEEGRRYAVGFAVHDDNITTRGHHVSFVRTVGFGVDADIRATRLP